MFYLLLSIPFKSATQELEIRTLLERLSGACFWTLGLPEGVLCNHPCQSVRPSAVRPSLNISETAHWFFLIFCMKLGHHKGTKVTEPDF